MAKHDCINFKGCNMLYDGKCIAVICHNYKSDRDYYKHLHTLAVERFRAAEALIRYAKILNHVQPEWNDWQQAIKAYNEWIQRVTNPQIGLK